MKKFLILFGVLILLPIQAKAQDISITPQMVEAYFNQLKELYTSEEPDMAAIIDFTEKHVDDSINIEYSYEMDTANDPVILHMDKTELINSLKTDKNKTLQSKMNYTITSFDVGETGKTVVVGNTIGWKSIIRGPDKSGKIMDTKMHSLSVCNDTFELKGDTLKQIENKCKIDLSISESTSLK